MTPERWGRVKELFSAAAEMPAADRAAFLAREAGDDAELIAEVSSLIDSHDTAGRFLEDVPPELRAAALDAGDSARAGERIGAYRLVEMIGTGGMGDVFKALRDDDQYRAEVAIKLMRSDVRNPVAEQRFKNERQILAALDHRNIARLLDGGTTPNSLPYVVMELVNGKPIDVYCDETSLGTRDRLQLFLQVCAAVSYAHQHLVVHRDLKPNNILVTADGSVKLLDFGIAKLLEPEAVTGTVTEETRTQLRAMTLDYASPEQVSGGTVTTASDVYSLGVVLYRLLTGQSPYRAQGGDAARMAEILGDTSPTRPSQVETGTRASIDSDLDHVLLMALRKEPAKRYGSVEQFANDLRNYLQGRPVLARRGSLGYRLGKLARRNKVAITAAALVVVSLVTGLGLAIREARIAEAERAVAQRHFNSVRKLANRLFDFQDEIARLPGATKARETLVKTSLEYLDALHQESVDDRDLRIELAGAYRKVGDIQGDPKSGSIGDQKGAAASYAKAVALLEPLYAADKQVARVGATLAKTYLQQSTFLFFTSGSRDAAEPARNAVRLAESNRAGFTDDFEYAQVLGSARWVEGAASISQGDIERGMATIDKMVTVAETYSNMHPNEESALLLLSSAYSNAAMATDPRMTPTQILERAEPLLRKALAANETLVALKPDEAKYLWSLAETRLNLANALCFGDRCAEAVALYRLANPVLAARAADPDNVTAKVISLLSDAAVAWALMKSGDAVSARSEFNRARASLLALDQDDNLQVSYSLARCDIGLGMIHAQRAQWRAAHEFLTRGVDTARKIEALVPADDSVLYLIKEGDAALAALESGAS